MQGADVVSESPDTQLRSLHPTPSCSRPAHLIPRPFIQMLPEHKEAQTAAGVVGCTIRRYLAQLPCTDTLVAHAPRCARRLPRTLPPAGAASAAAGGACGVLRQRGSCLCCLLLFVAAAAAAVAAVAAPATAHQRCIVLVLVHLERGARQAWFRVWLP